MTGSLDDLNGAIDNLTGLTSNVVDTGLVDQAEHLVQLGEFQVIRWTLLKTEYGLSIALDSFCKGWDLGTGSPSTRSLLALDTQSVLASSSMSVWAPRSNRRRHADQRYGELIKEIRALEGFEGFLLPPNVDELMAAADPYPIAVISLESSRCDAFLVEHHQIRLLPLPDLNEDDAMKWEQKLHTSQKSPLLEWLWDVAASPVLEALGYTDAVV